MRLCLASNDSDATGFSLSLTDGELVWLLRLGLGRQWKGFYGGESVWALG